VIKWTLPGDSRAANSAAVWLREHYAIPSDTPLFDLFEQEFNCQLTGLDRSDPEYCPSSIKFDDERSYTWFLLRWA